MLDLHRKGYEDEKKNVVAPVIDINGKSAAQVMIISCVDDGKLGIPNWQQNFRFAVSIADSVEKAYPGLMRPINISYNKYNQHLSPGALLLEFGTHGCTLEEATYSASLVGELLGELLLS